VCAIWLCPSTNFSSASSAPECASSRLAAVCRRSWKVSSGRPAARRVGRPGVAVEVALAHPGPDRAGEHRVLVGRPSWSRCASSRTASASTIGTCR
jgi:hypothetical protein